MRAALCLVLLLSGCAALSETECRGTDWYQLGKRDGEVYGSRAMIDQYTQSCAAFGVKPDEARYMLGWEGGNRKHRQPTGCGGGPDGKSGQPAWPGKRREGRAIGKPIYTPLHARALLR